MTILYKLTDAAGRTRGGSTVLQWGEGITHTCSLPDAPPVLCMGSVVHAYESPLVAALMDPIHGRYGATARLWEAEGDVVVREGGLKCGVRSLTTRRETPLPRLTTEQRVEVALRCALTVYREPAWVAWAERWLSGSDRSAAAAWAAEAAAPLDLHGIIAGVLARAEEVAS